MFRKASLFLALGVTVVSCGVSKVPESYNNPQGAGANADKNIGLVFPDNTFNDYSNFSQDEVKAAVQKFRDGLKSATKNQEGVGVAPQSTQDSQNCSSVVATGSAGKIYMHRISGQLFRWRVVMYTPSSFNYYDVETVINDWDLNLQLFQKEATGTVFLWYGDKFHVNVLAYGTGISFGSLTCWVQTDDYGY